MLAALPLLLAVAAPAPAPGVGGGEACKAAVLDLQAGEGVTKERARALSEAVIGEVGQHLPCTVLSRAEIQAMVSFEVQRQMAGCDAQSCLSEIGEALGVDRLVLGTISRINGRTLVSLRLVDMSSAVVLRRVTDSFAGADDDAILWIGWLARRLAMAKEADAGPRPVVEITERHASIWRTLAWTGVGTGAGVLLVAGGLGAGALGLSAALPSLKSARGADRRQISGLEETGPWLAGGANLGLYVGAALAVAGGALFFAPADEVVTTAETPG